MGKKIDNFAEGLCHLCMKTKKILFDLVTKDEDGLLWSHKLEAISGMKMSAKVTCKSCRRRLKETFEFRKMCISSNEVLNNDNDNYLSDALYFLEVDEDTHKEFSIKCEFETGDYSCYEDDVPEMTEMDEKMDISPIKIEESEMNNKSPEVDPLEIPEIKKEEEEETSLNENETTENALDEIIEESKENTDKTIETSSENIKEQIEPLENNVSIVSSPQHTCKFCNKNFTSPLRLRLHVKRVHRQIYLLECKISCLVCSMKFKHTRDLKLHMLSHNKDSYFVCTFCEKKFYSKLSWRKHLKVHESDINEICKICNKAISSNISFIYHTQWHIMRKALSEKSFYSCETCDINFIEYEELVKHSNELHGEGKIENVLEMLTENEDKNNVDGDKNIEDLNKNKEDVNTSEKDGVNNIESDVTNMEDEFKNIQNEVKSIQDGMKNIQDGMKNIQEEDKNIEEVKNVEDKIENIKNVVKTTEEIKNIDEVKNIDEIKNLEDGAQNVGDGVKSMVDEDLNIEDEFKNVENEVKNILAANKKEKKQKAGVVFRCNLCSRLFKTLENIKPHVTDCFMKIDRPKVHMCDICGKRFSSAWSMTNHKRGHSDVKAYICDICGQRFKWCNDLTNHRNRIHNHFRPYVCKLCGKRCGTSATLKSHMRLHTGEKPYSCHICKVAFSQNSSLKEHMFKHSDHNDEVCPICNKVFRTPFRLKTHLKRHNLYRKRYPCDICGRQFTEKNSVRKHKYKIHHQAS